MRSGSKFALDLAGAQFGYKMCLQPWKDYQQERILWVHCINAFGTEFMQNSESVKSVVNKTIVRPTMEETAKVVRYVLIHLAEWLAGGFKYSLKEAGWDIKKLLTCDDQTLYESVIHKALVQSLCALHVQKAEFSEQAGFVRVGQPVLR